MADIAALSLSVNSDQVKQAVATLNTLPPAASAAERAAQKWGATTDAAARSADDFSKRVQSTIASLEFQREQLSRTSDEQERYSALKRAGVAALSAEGQAITASVRALQAQKAALDQTSLGAKAYGTALDKIKSLLTAQAIVEYGTKLLDMTKEAVKAVAGLGELAEQVGVSTRALQGLQFVAVQNGVSLEELNTGLAKFSQKIGQAAGGNKEMIDSLTTLGVKILDNNNKLRPTEDVMQDVAKAILAIDDPAKRAAASVEFFGKAGTKFLPVLAEISKGTEATAKAADAFGVMVSDTVVKRLDAFSDAGDRTALRTRAWLGTFAGYVLLGVDASVSSFSKLFDLLGNWLSDKTGFNSFGEAFTALGKTITGVVDASSVEIARWSTVFTSAFSELGPHLGQVFADAWQSALGATQRGLQAVVQFVTANAPAWMKLTNASGGVAGGAAGPGLGGVGAALTQPGDAGPGFDAAGIAARSLTAGQAAADAQVLAQQQAAAAAGLSAQGGLQARGAARGTFGPPATVGAGNPAAKATGSGGETPEQRYAALAKQLENTKAAQDAMTAAAAKGDQAFEAQKASVEAQNKVLEIYKTQLSDTDPRLTKIRDLMISIAQGKVAEAFSVATTELEKQNVVLEAQIRLMNETPEIQAREIALIKAKQEAEKGGAAITQEALDARTQAIEQNEKLKAQQADLQKAQELWTAPLKQALQDIQTSAADAFEQILTSGNFSFQSLADTFKKIITKMIAEFLALATVRPIMSVVVDAIGSPSLAKDLGLSSSLSGGSSTLAGSGSGGGLFGSMGGGGLGNLFGGSGISDMFSNLTRGNGVSGLFQGAVPSEAGVMGPQIPGALSASSGLQMGSFGLGNLSGALGVGMGAMSLLNGGTKTTAGTIGGVGQMIGGGLMMIPTPWTMAAGAAISLLSSVLPSLFGGKQEPINSYGTGGLNYGAGGFQTEGSTYGANAEQMGTTGPLAAAGQSIQSIFDMLGGVKDSSKAFGLQLASFNQQYADGSSFSNKTSSIINPDGSRKQWGMGSTDADVGLASASAEVAIESILNGAVGKITDNMRKALTDLDNAGGPASLEQIQKTITDITAFDDAVGKFGHTTTDAENQIQQIDASFQGLYDTAKQYNLAASETLKIDQEKNRQELEATKGFSDNIAQQITAMTDPFKASMDAIGLAEAKDLATNSTYLKMVQGYADQSLSIEQLYQLQRQKVIDDSNAQALAAQQQAAAAQLQVSTDLVNGITASVNSIEDLIKQLSPGGDLGNVDPSSQLAGLRASYNASFAQAMADPTNQALIAKEVADTQAFAQTSLKFNAGGSAYVADQRMLLDQQQSLQGADVLSGVQSASDPAVKNLLQQLLGVVSGSTNDNSQRDADMATVISLLTRYLANGRTAA